MDGHLSELGEVFAEEHVKSFGYRTDAPYQMVNLRIIARGLSEESRTPERLELPVSRRKGSSQRLVYFGGNNGWIDTTVVDRGDLTDNPADGPLIIEEYDSTTVVPPHWRASVDSWRNIILERGT